MMVDDSVNLSHLSTYQLGRLAEALDVAWRNIVGLMEFELGNATNNALGDADNLLTELINDVNREAEKRKRIEEEKAEGDNE